MTDPIRAALETAAEALERVAFRGTNVHTMAANQAANAAAIARAALAAAPPAPDPTINDIFELCEDHEFHLGRDGANEEESAEGLLQIILVALARWGNQPPAPAPALPLDLDALLSPDGAYEPGTGQEDGAQLLNQLEWWAPMHGCDTLENLLDRIRGRILPHLRPPIAGIDVPGPDGDYGGLQELCEAEGVDVRIGAPLLKRAREAWEAWGATQPPAPAPAADGEREELAQWLDRFHEYAYELGRPDWGHMTTRAAALLRQPAPAPVAVSERPWEREGWCDAEGECWWRGRRDPAWWTAADPRMVHDGWLLPHWAIPRPPQGGEVAE